MKTNKRHTISNKSKRRMPSFLDTDWWQEIWITITHNKSRSFLTAFGVFWGMLMLVIMVGAGIALQRGIMSQIEGFATNSCIFQPNPTSEAYKGFRKGRWWNMANEDLSIIKQKVPEIQYISPILFTNQSDNNIMYREKAGSFQVKGFYPEYNLIETCFLTHGRYLNDIDILERRKVCVIGERVYGELFQLGEDPIGKNIQVGGIYFQVIGVARSISGMALTGQAEEAVILPFSTLQQAFNRGNTIDLLAITANPGVDVSIVEEKISGILKSIHTISPTDPTAIWSMNIEEQFNMFRYLQLGIQALIWIVGLGTLLAGGIGISNIMLVTVRERTKEIGIRRALGATPQNIITQILSESIILTIIAGLAGLMLGIGILQMVGIGLSQEDLFFKDPQISFSVAVSALFILLAMGTLAGFIPANRAMNIKPIDAIREE